MQDMSDIWDDLYEVKNADDVEMLIDNIASVLQKEYQMLTGLILRNFRKIYLNY